MRKAIRSLTILAVLGSVAQAAPFLAMGDSAEVFLTGTLGVRSDDNIYLASRTKSSPTDPGRRSDYIADIVPGFELLYGQNALTKGRAYYYETITRYFDTNPENTTLSTVGFESNYDDQKTKMNFNASYVQLAQNTVDIRANFLVRRDVFHVEGGSEISVTDKTSVAGSVVYENIDYKRGGFESSKIASVPLKYYYYVLPKLALSGGFTYSDTQLSGGGIGSKDYFYNVGARGEFTPKLTGTFSIGYTKRNMDAGPNQNTMGVDSSLAFAVDEKTSLNFGVTNAFGVSGSGQNERNLTWNVGFQSKVAEDWSAGSTLSYRTINYLGAGQHTDNYFEGSLNAKYTYSKMVNFTASVTYRNNSSSLVSSTFDNKVFAIAANIRY